MGKLSMMYSQINLIFDLFLGNFLRTILIFLSIWLYNITEGHAHTCKKDRRTSTHLSLDITSEAQVIVGV